MVEAPKKKKKGVKKDGKKEEKKGEEQKEEEVKELDEAGLEALRQEIDKELQTKIVNLQVSERNHAVRV